MTIHDTYTASRGAEEMTMRAGAIAAQVLIERSLYPLMQAYRYGGRSDLEGVRANLARAIAKIDAALAGDAP